MRVNQKLVAGDFMQSLEGNDIPLNYVQVWRWVCAGESEMWEINPHSVPSNLRENKNLAATIPGAPKPPETRVIKLEFWIDSSYLESTKNPDWLQIRAPISGLPIAGLRVYFPKIYRL